MASLKLAILCFLRIGGCFSPRSNLTGSLRTGNFAYYLKSIGFDNVFGKTLGMQISGIGPVNPIISNIDSRSPSNTVSASVSFTSAAHRVGNEMIEYGSSQEKNGLDAFLNELGSKLADVTASLEP